jgi:hypothetical protein
MPTIVATAIYPSHKQNEFIKIFIKNQGKFNVDDLVENNMSFINGTEKGFKIVNAYEVKPGKFDEVFMIIGQLHYQFSSIEGFEYNFEVFATGDEAVKMANIKLPE